MKKIIMIDENENSIELNVEIVHRETLNDDTIVTKYETDHGDYAMITIAEFEKS